MGSSVASWKFGSAFGGADHWTEFGSVVEVEVVAVDVNVVVTVVWVTVEFPAVLSVASVGTSVSST